MSGELVILAAKWPFGKVPTVMHVDRKATGLTDGAIVTYTFLQSWGQKNGRVFRRRLALAQQRGVKLRAFQTHLALLDKAGWIDRREEPRPGKLPLHVIQVREEQRVQPAAGVHLNAGEGCNEMQGGGASECTPPVHPDAPEVEEEEEGEEEKEKKGKRMQPPPATCMTAFVSESEVEEEVRAEDRHLEHEEPHAARTDAPRNAPALDVGGSVNADVLDPKEAARAGRAAEREAKKKPEKGKAVWPPRGGKDVAWRFLAEFRERYPEVVAQVPLGKDIGCGKNLMRRIPDPDDLLKVMRLAIWDWRAIRETVDTWYTGEKEHPALADVLKIVDRLVANTKDGIISSNWIVSKYRERWITETWKPTPHHTEPTMASEYRARDREREKKRRQRRATKG